MQPDHAGEIFYRRPDGKAVPHAGYHLDDQVEPDAVVNGPEVNQVVADYMKNSREFF